MRRDEGADWGRWLAATGDGVGYDEYVSRGAKRTVSPARSGVSDEQIEGDRALFRTAGDGAGAAGPDPE
jgi:hypothetical protein